MSSSVAQKVPDPGDASPLPDGMSLDAVFLELEARGMSVSFDRRLRAWQLFAQMAGQGAKLDRAAAAQWCASLLAGSREEHALVRKVVGGPPPPVAGDSPGLPRVVRLADKQRWLYVALCLALVAAGFAALFADLPGFVTRLSGMFGAGAPVADPSQVLPVPGVSLPDGPALLALPVPQNPERAAAALDGAIGFLFEDVLLPVYVLFPFLVGAWIVLQGRQARNAALQRRQGRGRKFTELVVPLIAMAPGPSDLLRRATERFKMQRVEVGHRLDVRRSLAALLSNPGGADIWFQLEKRNTDYLILAEGRASGSLRHLLFDRLRKRLEQSDTPFAQYELGAAPGTAVFRYGRRDGVHTEQLDDILRRYRGGRLVLCGSAQEILRRNARQKGSAHLSALVADFEIVLAFVTTPQARWGASEKTLQDAGVQVFECSDEGYVSAGAHLVSRHEQGGLVKPGSARIRGRTDPFLAHLSDNQLRFCSDVVPDAREVDALVRQTRAFLVTREAWLLFAAHCAVPRFDRAMSLFLADRVTGAPLDDATALRLSVLPWFSDNRIPDWMRLAVLRSLDPEPAQTLSRRLHTLYLELLGEIDGPLSESSTDVLIEAGVTSTLIDRLGLGASVIEGEGIFLRFLNGELSDELEQDIGDVSPTPGPRRLVGAAGLLIAGLLFAPFGADLAQGYLPVLFSGFATAEIPAGVVFAFCVYLVLLLVLLSSRSTNPIAWVVGHLAGVLAFIATLEGLERFPEAFNVWRPYNITSDPAPFLHLAVMGFAVLGVFAIHCVVATRGAHRVLRMHDVLGGQVLPIWSIFAVFFALGHIFGVNEAYFWSDDVAQLAMLSVALVLATFAILVEVLRCHPRTENANGAGALVELLVYAVLHLAVVAVFSWVLTNIWLANLGHATHDAHWFEMVLASAFVSYAALHNRRALGLALVFLVICATLGLVFDLFGMSDPLFLFLASSPAATWLPGFSFTLHAFVMLFASSVCFAIARAFWQGFTGGPEALRRERDKIQASLDRLRTGANDEPEPGAERAEPRASGASDASSASAVRPEGGVGKAGPASKGPRTSRFAKPGPPPGPGNKGSRDE